MLQSGIEVIEQGAFASWYGRNHQLKTDASAGLRRNARDPPPHIPIISKSR
jgi:hypothetical protein